MGYRHTKKQRRACRYHLMQTNGVIEMFAGVLLPFFQIATL